MGAWAFLIPWTVLAGVLGVAFGAMGLHYAHRGTGRPGPTAAGTTPGALGIIGTATLIRSLS
ncbi:hypothetical protein [Streptomyces sp. NPDC093598]|uniref:hypothetical protein n=1 Tax=Streptomyces sp. NPDC093598 TaxID=3366046 RepID=UPI0038140FCE